MQAELQGAGALQAAFERLKQKLKAEGLFAKERKRPLPTFPAAHRIGHIADGGSNSRCLARGRAAKSEPGNFIGAMPSAGRSAGNEVAAAIELFE